MTMPLDFCSSRANNVGHDGNDILRSSTEANGQARTLRKHTHTHTHKQASWRQPSLTVTLMTSLLSTSAAQAAPCGSSPSPRMEFAMATRSRTLT